MPEGLRGAGSVLRLVGTCAVAVIPFWAASPLPCLSAQPRRSLRSKQQCSGEGVKCVWGGDQGCLAARWVVEGEG